MKTGAHSGLRVASVMAVSALALSVSACGNFKEAIGATKQSPDEFAIQTRAPLAVPSVAWSLQPLTRNSA